MSRRPSGSHDGSGAMRWLLTYADLITLLLAFFIVLYAMSKVDQERYRSLASSLRQAFQGEPMGDELPGGGLEPLEPGADGSLSLVLPQLGEKALDTLAQRLADAVREQGLEGVVTIERREGTVLVSFDGVVLFDLGRAELKPEGASALEVVARLVRGEPFHTTVEGNADDLPIRTAEFPSNWELSAARALAVVHFLESQSVEAGRLSVAAYGEYNPRVPNDSMDNRSRNRRVDLVVREGRPSPTGLPGRVP